MLRERQLEQDMTAAAETASALASAATAAARKLKRPSDVLSEPEEGNHKRLRPSRVQVIDLSEGSGGQGSSANPTPEPQINPSNLTQVMDNSTVINAGASDVTTYLQTLAESDPNIRSIWRQIEFTDGWTAQDSVVLLALMKKTEKATGSKAARYHADFAVDFCAGETRKGNEKCLYQHMSREKSEWEDGEDEQRDRCNRCGSHRVPCLRVSASGERGKTWRLEKRK